MKDIQTIFSISDKEKRYDKLVEWIFSEILKNKGSIYELNEFSDERKVRKNGKKLIATAIFSKDPESSAWLGPAMVFKIFEKRSDNTWKIDLLFRFPDRTDNPELRTYRDLDFITFINPARSEIIREFIHN